MTEDTPKPEKMRASVSQIKKFKRCEYAWWREYGPLKIKPPPKPSAALGTKVHDVLEQWLLNGTPIPDDKAGRIASAGLDKLKPADELEIERTITMPLSENTRIMCRIDMMGKNSPYVGDHKTTKNFMYALTRSEVLRDPQLLTYCYAAYHETKPPEIEIELIYYRTTGQPVSISVGGVVKWEDVEENWAKMGEIAEQMAPKKNDPTGDSCTANPTACGDFGGCYHANVCPFSPQNSAKRSKTLTDLFNGDKNDEQPTTNNAPTGEQHKDEPMNKKTQSIRKSFGLLAPDAPPQVEQTDHLIQDAAKTIRAVSLAGPTDKKQIKNIMNTFGISKEKRSVVLELAGVTKKGDPTVETTPTPTPTKSNAAAKLLGGLKKAPVTKSDPTEEFKAKRCNAEDQKNVAALILEQFDQTMVPATSLHNWVQEQIAPSSLTDKRWNAILNYAGLKIDEDGNISIGDQGEEPQYTAPPKAHDAAHMTTEQIEDSEDPSDYMNAEPVITEDAPPKTAAPIPLDNISEENRIANFAKGAPAIASPLVVMVGCLFGATAPSNAVSFSMWVAPYIKAVEARAKTPFYMLNLDFGKGNKMLAGVIEAAVHQDTPTGLIIMDGDDELARVALPVLIRAGATVIRGS